MALKLCLVEGCGQLSDQTRCLGCRRAKARQREATRPSPNARGYGPAWRRLREIVLSEEPACRQCGHTGSPDNGLVVDHIIPKSQGGDDRRTNLRTLCRRCNGAKGGRERAQRAREANHEQGGQ
jgi:5-methylcytosine-specific restriction protein A